MTKGQKGRPGWCVAPAGLNFNTSLTQPEQIEQVILLIRGKRVMLDGDVTPTDN
jgi:hypothetical protein